jgi:hypothetical protein
VVAIVVATLTFIEAALADVAFFTPPALTVEEETAPSRFPPAVTLPILLLLLPVMPLTLAVSSDRAAARLLATEDDNDVAAEMLLDVDDAARAVTGVKTPTALGLVTLACGVAVDDIADAVVLDVKNCGKAVVDDGPVVCPAAVLRREKGVKPVAAGRPGTDAAEGGAMAVRGLNEGREVVPTADFGGGGGGIDAKMSLLKAAPLEWSARDDPLVAECSARADFAGAAETDDAVVVATPPLPACFAALSCSTRAVRAARSCFCSLASRAVASTDTIREEI